jgi:hypothetical protein
MTCQSGEGFELYRMLNKRLDPNNQISESTILADIRRLAFMKCKNLDETILRVVQLISLSNEFVDKVGREIDAKEKSFAVWMFMDEDTKTKAERSPKELVEGASTFSEVCDFLEILTNDGENRKAIAEYAKLQAPVRMDLSALAAGAPPPDAAALAEPPPPEAEAPALDAFGNPLKRYKCDGEGHRQADCPSREGIEVQCNKCKGWGHYAAECPSKGKKGKGKGKGDKGKG